MTLNGLYAKVKVAHLGTNRYDFLQAVNSGFCSRTHHLATIHTSQTDRRQTYATLSRIGARPLVVKNDDQLRKQWTCIHVKISVYCRLLSCVVLLQNIMRSWSKAAAHPICRSPVWRILTWWRIYDVIYQGEVQQWKMKKRRNEKERWLQRHCDRCENCLWFVINK